MERMKVRERARARERERRREGGEYGDRGENAGEKE